MLRQECRPRSQQGPKTRSSKAFSLDGKDLRRRKGRPSTSIIEVNRKTELCRGWLEGTCSFRGRCAFAHGTSDMKHKTLIQLQQEGRIADASKHHSCLCTTWVAIGACPYGQRCVFIHDARAGSLVHAPLLASHQESAGSIDSSRSGTSRRLCLSGGDRGSPLFFPDIPRDPGSVELPADHVLYDVDASMSTGNGQIPSTVFKVWYSFLSTLLEMKSAILDTPIISTNTRSYTGISPAAPAAANTAAVATPTGLSYRDATTRSSYACGTAVAAAGYAGRGGAGPSSLVSTSRLGRRPDGFLETHRPWYGVKHLPVFDRLSRGIPANPDSPPESPVASVQQGGEEVLSPAPTPHSSCSPTSPWMAGDSTIFPAAAIHAEVGLEDSSRSFSHPWTAPLCESGQLSRGFETEDASFWPPITGRGVRSPTASWGGSLTTSNDDAASWTPSSVFSFERDGDQSHDIFRYTQHLKQPARASWSTAEEAASTFCVSDAMAPLPPRFVGSSRSPATASNNAMGGVFCMAPAGEGGLSCVREASVMAATTMQVDTHSTYPRHEQYLQQPVDEYVDMKMIRSAHAEPLFRSGPHLRAPSGGEF
ncbi:unnamed protein product [Pylaiella littoralis]